MIRAHVALRRDTVLPGDVRRSKPPRAFQIVLTDTDGPIWSSTTYLVSGTIPLAQACDIARGFVGARHAANIRRAVLDPSEA